MLSVICIDPYVPFDRFCGKRKTNYESAFKTIRAGFFVCVCALLYWFPILSMALVKRPDTAQCIIVIVIDAILIELFGLFISTGFTCMTACMVFIEYINMQPTTHAHSQQR